MTRPPRSVSFDPARGYARLHPVPNAAELEAFYRQQYYQTAGQRRAPDLQRLTADDERAERERRWRDATIYADVVHLVGELGVGHGAAMDIGCGTGEFVNYLSALDSIEWKASGIELAPDAVERATARGLDVRCASSEQLDSTYDGRFDLVTMFNVLEHLLDPESALADARRLLRPGGVLVVQVPNDFSVLQEATRSALDTEPWWIADPDHVNYFTFGTLESTLAAVGFDVRTWFCTFPMELFLIAGLDYVGDATTGPEAHRRRCEFELALDPVVRRALYQQFAAAGIGRNCVLLATRP